MKKTVKIPKNRLTAPVDFGAVISMHRVGDIRLTYLQSDFIQFSTNKIVLFDAYSAARRYAPLDGEYGIIAFPFSLCCMTDRGERIAYAGLKFCEEEVVRWDAVCSPSDLLRLASDPDAASVPIISGVCVFADENAYKAYSAHINDDLHPLSGLIVLDGQTHTTVELYGSKYAVFSSGWGDGLYRCYVGRTASGRAAILIADFGMIDYDVRSDDEYEEVQIDCDANSAAYEYDPSKSESENRIAQWTYAIDNAIDPSERLRAYSRRGYAYHSMNETDAALSDYLAAIAERKNVVDRNELLNLWSVYDNAAEILCQKSDYQSAIDLMLDELAVGDNLYGGVYVRLIDLYLLTKNIDSALEIAAKMIETRRDDPVACIKSAEVFISAMDYRAAADMYERLASEFQLYENLLDEASCLISINDFVGAESALERFPTKEYSEQYWYYKAYIHYKKGEYYKALEIANRSYDIDKKFVQTIYLLIDIHSVLQDYHSVARYAEEFKKLRPDAEYGYSVCAEAHLILGNFTECARNYNYLYDGIKSDDKYAALSAILSAKTGDQKRKSAMLKKLRHKKSAYYYGATYAIYITKYRERDNALSKVVYKLAGDDDFLLQLAAYLTATNNVLPASHLLEMLCKHGTPTYEIVSQQIRAVELLGDKKLFDSFMKYYIQHFLGKDISCASIKALYSGFIGGKQNRGSWLPDIETYIKTLDSRDGDRS